MVIDSHCHLHDPALPDALDTLRVAQSLDVWGVIAVGCDAESNARTLALAAAAPKAVWACLGLHPDQERLGDADLEAVERQAAGRASTGCWRWRPATTSPSPCTRRTARPPRPWTSCSGTASSARSFTGTR